MCDTVKKINRVCLCSLNGLQRANGNIRWEVVYVRCDVK